MINKKISFGIFIVVITIFTINFLVTLLKPQQQIKDNIIEKQDIQFKILTSDELAAALEKKDFFFINVHIPYEGEIKNTDVFIPYDKIAENIDKLPKDKNIKIVLYCRSGRMSEIAAKELIKLGYTNISHLGGGMIDWEKKGYEIIKN